MFGLECKSSSTERREFYRELMALAIPVGLHNLLSALIGASDALMLGRLTQNAVAAVSLANQITFIMNLFSGAVVSAGGALIAQYWGKGDRLMVKNLLCMLIKFTTGIALTFSLLALLVPEGILRIYTRDEALISIGASYLRIVGVSYLCGGVTQCCFMMMKVEGRAAKSVIISVATLLTDVVLDFFLIYGVAFAPKLGANGSAYSTIVVEVIALVWCVAETRRPGAIRPDIAGFRWFSGVVLKDLMKIALPMLAGSLVWGVGFSMHSMLMGRMDSDAIAAASITSVAQELVSCMCRGVCSGTGIMIGKLLGQNLFDKAKVYGRRFSHLALLIGGFHMVLLALIGPLVSGFFILTDAAREYLTMMLIFSGIYMFAYSLNVIVVCGVFPAGGDSRYDAVSVVFSMWCFAMPLALLGAFVFEWPVMVVYVLMCSDELVKLPWIYPRYRKFIWLKNLTRDDVA